MRVPLTLRFVIVFVLAVLAPEPASAFSLLSFVPTEWPFHLGEWSGNVDGGYEWEDLHATNNNAASTTLSRNRFDESVKVRNQGLFLLDPRLVVGTAGVSLDFYQEKDNYNNLPQNANGVLLGYDLTTTFFSEKAYTGTVFANRNETDVTSDFAGRIKTKFSTLGAIADLREYSILQEMFPYFSSTVGVRQEIFDQSTEQLGQTYKLDETRDVAHYGAVKGFQTADLSFDYDYLDDAIRGTNELEYQSHNFSLLYSLDWGPTRNRRWDSRIHYLTRSGSFGESLLWADESLRIDHRKDLFTLYRYYLTSIEIQGERTTTHTASFDIQHRLFQNVTSDAGVDGLYTTFPDGRMYLYAGSWSESYEHSIPWGGRLSLSTYGRYQVSDNAIKGGNISVTDEPHVAPSTFGATNGFTLNNPFVVSSTIVMYDVRDGRRIPAQLGVDYTVAQLGNQAQIVIVPTTMVIQPGDPLEVSYVYQTAPSVRYSTTTLDTSVGVYFEWIDFSLGHGEIRETLLSGRDTGFLYNARYNVGRMDVHKRWGSLEARLDALYEKYDSNVLSYVMENFGQFLFWQPNGRLMLSAAGDETFTDLTSVRQRTSSRGVQLSADWYTAGGSFAGAYARYRSIETSSVPTETDLETGIDGRWIYGKFEIVPALRFIYRKWGAVTITDPQCQIRIIRLL